MADKKLTAKQQTFVNEYLIDLNATQAAVRAGYSEKTAQQTGSENLLKPVIKNAIQEAMDKRSQKTEITAEFVLKGIKDLTQKVELSDSPAAAYKGYELLGKHLKLFTDRIEEKQEVVITEIQRKIV